MKVGSKSKSIKTKALPKSPAFGNEDTELLWELFGMRLNVLCRNLLKELMDNMERPSMYIGTVDKVEELMDNVERPSTNIKTDDEVEELVENMERPLTYIGTVDESKKNSPEDSKINQAATIVEPENYSAVEEKNTFDSPAETKIDTNEQERIVYEIKETETIQSIKPRKQKPPRKKNG